MVCTVIAWAALSWQGRRFAGNSWTDIQCHHDLSEPIRKERSNDNMGAHGRSNIEITNSEIVVYNYSMVQSPSWKANWFASSQEIPCISRNPKVHYRTHKRPPPVSILGQPNPVHIPTSHLLEMNPNITHPSTPRSFPSYSVHFC